MERFLERVSVSEYRNNFILKGGMLVASIVGVDMRATMDIDTTVKALPLNEKNCFSALMRISQHNKVECMETWTSVRFKNSR